MTHQPEKNPNTKPQSQLRQRLPTPDIHNERDIVFESPGEASLTGDMRIQSMVPYIETEKIVGHPKHHQEFQVPKMKVLNLIRLFWGWGFPYINLTYSLCR